MRHIDNPMRSLRKTLATAMSAVLVASASPIYMAFPAQNAYAISIPADGDNSKENEPEEGGTSSTLNAPYTESPATIATDTAEDKEPVLESITATIAVSYVSRTNDVDPGSTFALLDEAGNQLQVVSPSGGQITFAPVSLPIDTLDKVYIYQIKGLGGDNTDIKYDTRTMRVMLTVKENADKKLYVSQTTTEDPVFIDKYPNGSLTVSKETTDGDYSAEHEFTVSFNYPNDDGGGEYRKTFCAWYQGDEPYDYDLGHILYDGTQTDNWYLDGYMVFGVGEPDDEYNGNNLTQVWYDIENMDISSKDDIPWQYAVGGTRYNLYGTEVTCIGSAAHIAFRDRIYPKDISYWFADATAVLHNIENLDLSHTKYASHAFDGFTELSYIDYRADIYYGIVGPIKATIYKKYLLLTLPI